MVKVLVPNTRSRLILYCIVVFSILLSASGSYLVVYNGHQDSLRVECQALYNELEGTARDERNTFADTQTKAEKKQVRAELHVWTQFSKPIQGTSDQQAAVFYTAIADQIASLKKKLKALRESQITRAENPYPDPNACADNKITEEEGNTQK